MNKIRNINWVDGMKINKSHFQHNDRVRQYQIQESSRTFIKSYEYGVLPNASQHELPMLMMEDGFIKVNHLRLITRRGQLIDVGPEDGVEVDIAQALQAKYEQAKTFLVTMSADDYDGQPVGTPDPDELPPRHPFLRPKYRLSIVPVGQVNTEEFADHFIPICRLERAHESVELDLHYIPPCAQIVSHIGLLDRYVSIEKIISDIGNYAKEVVQKARSKKRHGEINDLANHTFYFVEKVVFFLAENMNQVRTLYKEESPIFLFSFLNSFGRVMHTALSCIRNVDREALLRYYESHSLIKPDFLQSEIQALSTLEYDHLNLNTLFDKADVHLSTIETLMRKALEFEYHSVERVDVLNESVVKKSKLDIF